MTPTIDEALAPTEGEGSDDTRGQIVRRVSELDGPRLVTVLRD